MNSKNSIRNEYFFQKIELRKSDGTTASTLIGRLKWLTCQEELDGFKLVFGDLRDGKKSLRPQTMTFTNGDTLLLWNQLLDNTISITRIEKITCDFDYTVIAGNAIDVAVKEVEEEVEETSEDICGVCLAPIAITNQCVLSGSSFEDCAAISKAKPLGEIPLQIESENCIVLNLRMCHNCLRDYRRREKAFTCAFCDKIDCPITTRQGVLLKEFLLGESSSKKARSSSFGGSKRNNKRKRKVKKRKITRKNRIRSYINGQ